MSACVGRVHPTNSFVDPFVIALFIQFVFTVADAEKEFQHIRLSEMNNEKKATSDLKSDVENQLRAKLRKVVLLANGGTA